ncbi:hypothetical protein Ddye_027228 [Dipteronia dyeriana]|uniref:Uncharacterized protein n=1 Tax=Dipteronia dyeriana TaxID=168575 RepID=A0AAD9TP67_9ROSI|nr:hypothetical protein Ddye_027228 [Dipteronia dyeriana]
MINKKEEEEQSQQYQGETQIHMWWVSNKKFKRNKKFKVLRGMRRRRRCFGN